MTLETLSEQDRAALVAEMATKLSLSVSVDSYRGLNVVVRLYFEGEEIARGSDTIPEEE